MNKKFNELKELFQIMDDIVRYEVKDFSTDLRHDIERIQRDVENNKEHQYLWITRESGTWLLRKDKTRYKMTEDYYIFDYCVFYHDFISMYEIDIKAKIIKQLFVEERMEIWAEAQDTIPQDVAMEYINEFIEENKNILQPQDLERNVKRLKNIYQIA